MSEHKNRGLSVDGVILRGKKILLIKRGNDPFKGHWALPGGYVDWNETTEEAVAREVLEETGLKVISAKLTGIYSSPSRHPQQVITIGYLVETSGEPKAGDDALEFNWFSLGELPSGLAFDHNKIIGDALPL
jgi:8-oxo-dGTP diphosphatase